jgi:hypothetical protein
MKYIGIELVGATGRSMAGGDKIPVYMALIHRPRNETIFIGCSLARSKGAAT